jgi:hypothetical protein
MRRALSLFSSLALLASLLAVTGCGGGAPVAPAAQGHVSIKVAWPTAGTRLIPASAYRMDVAITGPGIATPITASFSRATSSISLVVPAGSGRTVDLTCFDDTQTAIAHGAAGGVTVAADATTPVTITLEGTHDPNDWYHPVPLTLVNGTATIEEILDTRGSSTDAFVFDAVEGQGYSITFEALEGVVSDPSWGWFLRLHFIQDGTLADYADVGWNATNFGTHTSVVTAAATGPLKISCYFGNYWYQAYAGVRYRITVTEGGDGSINATVQ